jgi:hypothetical protein
MFIFFERGGLHRRNRGERGSEQEAKAMRRWMSICAAAWLLACGSSSPAGSSSTGSGNPDGGGGGSEGGAADGGGTTGDSSVSAESGSAIDAGPTGTGTISGTAGGQAFNNVALALWIGAPDDPTTTVVYLFSKVVDCAKLHPPGWADDGRLPQGTQFLEIKMKGTAAPDSFTVVSGAGTGLAAHEASVNNSITTAPAGGPASASVETIASGGTVTMASLTANTNVTGTFDVKFGTDGVKGTYNAKYCAGGTEP